MDDRVNCGSATSLDNMAAMTLCAWIRHSSMGENGLGRIFDKSVTTAPHWSLMMDGTNGISFRSNFSSSQLTRVSASNAITLNTWQHVVATWDGSATAANVRLYVNGVEVSYSVTTNATGTRPDESAATLSIGNDSTTARTYAGRLDRASVYNRVLSTDEILAIYRGGLSQ